MKLSELVKLKENLISGQNYDSLADEFRYLEHELESAENAKYTQNIMQTLTIFRKTVISGLKSDLSEAIASINVDIANLTTAYFQDSYNVMFENNADWARKYRYNTMQITTEIEHNLTAQIRLHSDWRYPALEIGCYDGYWTKHMIASDPLYITSQFSEFLTSTASQFPEEYQRRLRPYEIVNDKLPALPENQFNFVFSWNYFNYLPLGTVKEYLQYIWKLLTPGGVVLFTFNDGDTWRGAENTELNFMTYVPKSMLVPMCESLGYEILTYKDYTNTVTYLEIKKPGTLSTIKRHQVLGTVKEISQSI